MSSLITQKQGQQRNVRIAHHQLEEAVPPPVQDWVMSFLPWRKLTSASLWGLSSFYSLSQHMPVEIGNSLSYTSSSHLPLCPLASFPLAFKRQMLYPWSRANPCCHLSIHRNYFCPLLAIVRCSNLAPVRKLHSLSPNASFASKITSFRW